MEPTKITRKPFIELDILRAAAAVAVLMGHARNLFFVDYPDLSHPGVFSQSLYFLSGLGHSGVMVFFVLSGFLVGGKVIRQIGNRNWSWRVYLIERITRLVIVLWPALLLTALFDHLGEWFFGFFRNYSAMNFGSNVLPPSLAAASTLRVYIENAVFLQGIYVPQAGTNGPLWSLSFEFWYYLLFPALVLLFTPSLSRAARLKSVFCLAFAGYLVWRGNMAEYFIIWVLGAAVATVQNRRFSLPLGRRLWLFLGGVLFVAALVVSRLHSEFRWADHLVGLTTAVLCLVSLSQPQTAPGALSRAAGFLSSFSYSVYLCHLPFLIFLRVCLRNIPRWQPDLLHLGFGFILVGMAVSYSYLIARLTEYHTQRVRDFLSRRFRAAVPPPVANAFKGRVS